MSTTTRPGSRLMTAEEFCEFVHSPENADRFFELDRGEVIELPPPQRRHGIVCGHLSRILGNYAAQPGHGQMCPNDTGVVLSRMPDTVRGPDLTYFANRLSLEDADAEAGYTEEIPVLAVEVLSPTDRPSRVARKVAQYLRAGVRVVWVVDPEVREVAVHRPGVEMELLEAEAMLTGGDDLPGFECRVAEFFGLPGEAKAEG